MNLSLDEAAEILGDVFVGARSREGKRLSLSFAAGADGESLSITVALFAEDDQLSDLREWSIRPPAAALGSAGRLRALAEGSLGSLDWERLYPEDFPCWPLLKIESLRSAGDFARLLEDPAALLDALAGQWAAEFGAENRLPALPPEACRELYPLSLGLTPAPALEANLRALSSSEGPVVEWLLALFERWADEIEADGSDAWVAPDDGSLRVRLATLAAGWLTPRADPAQAARLDRLRERDLIEPPPPDYDALFASTEHEGIPLAVVEVGRISLPTGRVIAADPFFSAESRPINATIEPGSYPVRIALGSLPDWGHRVLAARLDLLPGPAASWRRAGSSFGVDAGLACFMSIEACDAFERERSAFREAQPDGNYYTVLEKSLAATAPSEDGDEDLRRFTARVQAALAAGGDPVVTLSPGRPAGKWALHRFGEGHSMAIFASGLGDGFYEVLAGEDAAGRVVSLLIDFGLIERS